jgi:hypothetical protein
MDRRAGLIAVDAVAVLAFAAIGRASHDEAVGGVLATAAPFLVGALVGVLVGRTWRAPLTWRSGVFTWIGAAAIGLALRFALTGRLPLSFVLVATVALGVLVLGWRGAGHLVAVTGCRRRRGVRA